MSDTHSELTLGIIDDSESYLSSIIGAMQQILGQICFIFWNFFGLVVGTIAIGW